MGHDTLSPQWAGGVRDGYPAGVPCWIDTTQRDPQAAADFYHGLLSWELEDMMPPNSPGQYFVARLNGRDVAAISSIAASDSTRAMWNTYVWVDNADETAQRVEQARGRVLAAPFDVPGAGAWRNVKIRLVRDFGYGRRASTAARNSSTRQGPGTGAT